MAEVMLFLKNLLFIVIAPGTVAVYLPWLIAGDGSSASGIWLAGSTVLFVAGGAVYLRCVWDFAVFGRGTPAPIDPPKRLVVRGLYRYLRNPMYVGVLTTILAWAVLFRAPLLLLYAFGVGAVCHTFVVLYEEPHLRKIFGKPYDDYCSRVGRWLPSGQAVQDRS
jgi:protein-S-isoprenylcysteine O-methyltransferase Ste14